MKFTDNTVQLETNLNTAINAFTIKMSAHAFRTLSKTIYSDPIKAVIRELCCNAIDAHISAGKADVPIKVNLPTMLKPSFSVHDEGIGLSFKDVETLFTTYFDSTKTESNDTIGGFGLGSKSPFAYTDQFTVTARWNGVQRIYVCFMSNGDTTPEGTPSIRRMGNDTPTKEHNGLTVEFPVKTQDNSRFTQKFFEVAEWFAVKPIVNVPWQVSRFESKTPVIQGENWKAYAATTYGESYKFLAVQGGVAYPINTFDFDIGKSLANELSRHTVIINFPIGSLSPAPSREQLSYDKRTAENLKKAFNEIKEQCVAKFNNIFDDVTNEWEASRKYLQYYKAPFASLAKFIYNGNPVTDDVLIDIRSIKSIDGVKVHIIGSKISYSDDVSKHIKDYYTVDDAASYSYKAKESFSATSTWFTWFPHSRAKQGVKLAKWWRTVQTDETFSRHNMKVVVFICPKEKLKEITPYLKGAPVITEFEEIPRAAPKPKSMVAPYRISYSYCGGSIKNIITKEDVDINTKGYYARTEFFDMENSGLISKALNCNLISSKDFVVVPKSMWKQFDDSDNWTNVKELIEERWKKVNIDAIVRKYKHNIKFSKYEDAPSKLMSALADRSDLKNVPRFLKACKMAKSIRGKLKPLSTTEDNLLAFARHMGYTLPEFGSHTSELIEKKYKKYVEKHSLLKAVDRVCNSYYGFKLDSPLLDDVVLYLNSK